MIRNNFLVISALFLMCLTSKTIFCNNMKTDMLRQTRFPPCKACKTFIESFKKV